MIYVGMDVHKKTTTICAIDDDGKVVKRSKVTSGEVDWIEALSSWDTADVRVALETGSLTWWAVDSLRRHGIEPVVVDARSFKLVAESKKKSDRFDARALADGLRGGLAERCAVSVPDTKTRRARCLMQTRQQILKQLNMTINAAKALLRSVGVEIKKSDWAKEAKWNALLDNPAIPIWMKPLLVTQRDIWEFLERERESLDAMVAEESGHWPEAEPLRELPGFGPVVTMGILSGIGDITRFKRPGQLASYAGLIPSSRDSGGIQRRGGITRQGRGLMRHLAVQAAWAAMRSKNLTPPLRKWVRRLIVKRGRQVAAVALARRLLVMVHKILTNGEAYNPTYPVVVL